MHFPSTEVNKSQMMQMSDELDFMVLRKKNAVFMFSISTKTTKGNPDIF